MSWDLMGYLSRALSWTGAGGADVGKNTHVDGGASVGAGGLAGQTGAHDILGGMVGGFGGPMDWKGAGFGGQANGKVSNSNGSYLGGNAGLGFGAGGSSWSMNDGGTKLDGVSGAAGGVAPVGFQAGNKSVQGSASTNFYSGAGGSAYTYDGPNGNGVGLKGNIVPLGAADTNLGLNTPYGSASAHADNMYLNKISGSSTFGQDSKGVYNGQSQASMQTGVEGVNGKINTPLGNWNAGAGSVNYGVQGNLGGSYDPKTGQANGNVGFNEGLNATNLNTGFSSPNGQIQQNASAGSVFYGTKGNATANYDPKTGLTGTFAGEGGGVNVQNIKSDGKFYGASYNASLGEFSNTTQITDGKFAVDGQHATVGGSADGMGMRFKNFDANGQIGSGPNAVKANAGFDSLGNSNSITNASVTANYGDLKNPSLNAKFDSLSYGDWSGTNLHAGVTGPGGSSANAKVGSFGLQGINASGFDATLNKDGLNANLKHGDYSDVDVQNVEAHAKLGNFGQYDAKLGEFATDKVNIDNAHVDSSFNLNDPSKIGAHASAGSASYDQVMLKGLSGSQDWGNGAYKSSFNLDSGSFNHFDAKNLHAGADLTNGIDAGLTDGHYSYLAGKNLDLKTSVAGGALGVNAHVGSASALGVDAGKLDFKSTLKDSHLDIENLGAHGLQSSDVNVGANIGKLDANVGAKQLNLLDLNVGSAKADTSNFGTTGSASVNNANLDAVNIQGGHAGLGWGGKEMLGATGDYKAGAGLGSASGNWNLMGGTADAKFKDASVGGQLSNASVNLFGNKIALPDMGAKLNASGGANVDLSQGAASANLSLAGSNVNFAGHSLTVPQWAQASGGVNLSQGAVNANLGGANGVGADVNLSKGQFDVNAFGHHLDVAQGVRDVGTGIANTASAVGNGVSNAASTVGHGISNAASAVGGFVSHLW